MSTCHRLASIFCRQISQGDDAHEPFVAAEHRQLPHLLFPHEFGGIRHVSILEAVMDLRRHHFPYTIAARIVPARHRAHDDITVGQDTDQMVVVTNRQRTDVDDFHSLCRLLESGFWPRAFRVARHHVADLHDLTPEPRLGEIVSDAGSNPVTEIDDTLMFGAMSAAEHRAVLFDAMTEYLATAMRTRGRQGMDGALERIESMLLAFHRDREGFVIVISANVTSHRSTPC